MADTRTPAQTATDTGFSTSLPADVRDFGESILPPLLEMLHRAETYLPQWEDRAAAGAAGIASERTRLLLGDGEIGVALASLDEAVRLETLEPLTDHPFAATRAQIHNAWTDWRERHGLPENALPRTYPVTGEKHSGESPISSPTVEEHSPEAESAAPFLAPSDPEATEPAAQDEKEGQEALALLGGKSSAPTEEGTRIPETGAPPLDLPSDQEAAELAAQREKEEQEAIALLKGKSPDGKPEHDPKDAQQVEETVDAEIQTVPQGQESDPEVQSRTMPSETSRSEPPALDRGSTSPQKQHISGQHITIRSAGFLTTLAQGFNQRRERQIQSREAQQKAQRLDAAREKFSRFTAAAHQLERQGEALLQHPVMEAVRQAAPEGISHADAGQKALIGSIVRSNPDFQSQVQALQQQHAEVVRRFDALEPELDEIPAKERRAYTDIADRHLKKAEEHLQQLPDQKGNSIWERLKESFRAIGQRLGIIGPDLSGPMQTAEPAAAPVAHQAPRPGRH